MYFFYYIISTNVDSKNHIFGEKYREPCLSYDDMIKRPIKSLLREGNSSFIKNKFVGTEVNLGCSFSAFTAACEKGSKYGCHRALYLVESTCMESSPPGIFIWILLNKSPQKFKDYIEKNQKLNCNKKIDKDYCKEKFQCLKQCDGCFFRCALQYKNPYNL